MTWFAQVRHIAWKDARQARWILAVYVTMVIVATVRSIALPFAVNGFVLPVMFLVVMTGIAVAATLVQSDSPIRSDALWASRPFYPTAILAAKVVLVFIVIILLPVAGEVAALGAFQVPGSDLAYLARQSALTYTLWLLVAVLVAALTPDLRSFVVTFLGLIVGLLLLAGIPLGLRSPFALRLSLFRTLIAVLVIALGIALLVGVYRTHHRGVRVWAGAIAVVALALTAVVIGYPLLVYRYWTMNPQPKLSIQIAAQGQIAKWEQLQLTVDVDDLPDTLGVGFAADTAILHLRDGRAIRIEHPGPSLTLFTPELPIRPAVRWLGSEPRPWRSNRLGVSLTDHNARAIERDLVSVELVGAVVFVQPRLAGALPLRVGASVTHEGMRARIGAVDYTSDDPTIDLETSSARRERVPYFPAQSNPSVMDSPRYWLLNTARGEAVPLYSRSSSGSSDWLLLPGASVQESALRLHAKIGPGSVVPDQEWLRDAKLLIVDWVPVASYALRPQATLR